MASAHITVSNTQAGVDPETPPPLRLTPAANPSYGQLYLMLDLDREGPGTVQVFDPQGRRVADLIKTSMGPGSHPLHWRGLDHSGRPTPSGVYLIRAEAAGRVLTARVVMVH